MSDALMFQAEVRRIEKLLYRIAWSYMGNNADAEDAVQDALIKAWERRESLRDLKLFRPWMARILTNQCKDLLRTRKNGASVPWKTPPRKQRNLLYRRLRSWRLSGN